MYQLGVLGNFISWNPEIPQNCAHVSMHCVYRQCVCIYVCVYIEREMDRLDGWMDGSMDRWIDGSMDRWIDGSMDRWIDG